MVCIQEARLKSDIINKARQRGRPLPSEWAVVRHCFEGLDAPFGEYEPIWSLGDTRHAGTLTLLRKDMFPDGTCRQWAQKNSAFTFDGAIDLMLGTHGLRRDQVGLEVIPDVGGDGQGAENDLFLGKNFRLDTERKRKCQSSLSSFIKSSKKVKQQTSMSSFFSTSSNSSSKPTNTATEKKHDPEGRIQFLSFPKFDLLHTYVPNNGGKASSFQRRKEWDLSAQRFLLQRKALLKQVGEEGRPILWCGDLNIGRDYRDGTHWTKEDDGRIGEWFTDESKCFGSGNKGWDPKEMRKEGDWGMPGFTPNERIRFEQTLKNGDLVDVWREIHPKGLTTEGHAFLDGNGGTREVSKWERAEWTWRGACGTNVGRAKFQGRAMRLDYFLLSAGAYRDGVVKECIILGYGERRFGLFGGSDHCPSLLTFADED